LLRQLQKDKLHWNRESFVHNCIKGEYVWKLSLLTWLPFLIVKIVKVECDSA
jgi:poly(3-hydroxyalkanoate) synthetase